MKEYFGWTEGQLSFFVGSVSFFCIAGAMAAGWVCDTFGRRKTFTISCFIFIVGLLGQCFASGFAVAMVGRVLVGIGIGLGLSIGE